MQWYDPILRAPTCKYFVVIVNLIAFDLRLNFSPAFERHSSGVFDSNFSLLIGLERLIMRSLGLYFRAAADTGGTLRLSGSNLDRGSFGSANFLYLTSCSHFLRARLARWNVNILIALSQWRSLNKPRVWIVSDSLCTWIWRVLLTTFYVFSNLLCAMNFCVKNEKDNIGHEKQSRNRIRRHRLDSRNTSGRKCDNWVYGVFRLLSMLLSSLINLFPDITSLNSSFVKMRYLSKERDCFQVKVCMRASN